VTSPSPDVIIVGAGFAGLSAGALLAERGARVLVLDARPQLGGRATAFLDRQTGELVDNGQHVLFGCYRETLAFLRRIDALGNVRMQPSMEVAYLDTQGRRSVLRCPPLPSPLNLLAAVEGLRLAAASGLDADSTLKAVGAGAAGSWMLSNQGPKIAACDFRPGFLISLHQKDLRLATELFHELGLDAPGTELTYRLFTEALQKGLGDLGNQALYKLWS
jgi:hypothetical protein